MTGLTVSSAADVMAAYDEIKFATTKKAYISFGLKYKTEGTKTVPEFFHIKTVDKDESKTNEEEWDRMVADLPKDDGCFVIFDVKFTTDDSRIIQKPILVTWYVIHRHSVSPPLHLPRPRPAPRQRWFSRLPLAPESPALVNSSSSLVLARPCRCPDSVNVKKRMLIGSNKDSVKREFEAVQRDVHATDASELEYSKIKRLCSH